MARNFETKIAINWLCVDDSDKAIGYGGGVSGRRQNADIPDTPHLGDVAMATNFWLSMGYNFGCMIASDTLFDSRGEFSGSSYPMKTADFEVLRDVAIVTVFGFLYMGAH